MPAKLAEKDVAPLAQKVALVTGASRGIGRAIASRLGRMGASVAICARNRDEIERTAAAFRKDGIQTLPIAADVTRAEDVNKMIGQTCSQLGEIEILVNNAGIGVFGPFYERPETDWDAVLGTNRVPGKPGGSTANGPFGTRPHHQYQFSCIKERFCRRSHLLRLEVGVDGVNRLHGRGLEGAWYSGKRHLPRERGHRVFSSRGARSGHASGAQRRGARRSHAGHPR